MHSQQLQYTAQMSPLSMFLCLYTLSKILLVHTGKRKGKVKLMVISRFAFFFFFFKLLAEGWYLRSSLKPRTNQVLTWGITVLFALLTEARLPEGEQALLGGKGTRTSFSKGKPVEGCTRDLAPEGARGCGRTGGTEGLLREGAGARPSLAFAEAGCWQLKGKRYRRFEQLINEPRTPGSMLYLRQSCRRKKEPGWFYLPP